MCGSRYSRACSLVLAPLSKWEKSLMCLLEMNIPMGVSSSVWLSIFFLPTFASLGCPPSLAYSRLLIFYTVASPTENVLMPRGPRPKSPLQFCTACLPFMWRMDGPSLGWNIGHIFPCHIQRSTIPLVPQESSTWISLCRGEYPFQEQFRKLTSKCSYQKYYRNYYYLTI